MSNKLIEELRARRLNAWEQAKALNESTITESRDGSFTAEEQATWERINADMGALDQRIAALVEAEQRNADAENALGSLGRRPVTEGPKSASISDEFRALAAGEKRSVEFSANQGAWDRRDLTKGTATAGGHTVPTSFYDRLVEHMIEVSGVLMAGPTVLNTTSGENLEVPVTTGFSTGALTAEAAAISESDPAFQKRTLGAYKYATLIQVARELLEDAGVDLSGFLARQAGRAVGNALGTHLVTGTGSSQPSGVVTGSSLGVTGGAGVTGAFTADNLIDLHYSVIAPYRNSPSCSWLMRDATVAAVRKLKDSQNQYLWQPALTAGTPDVLLGKPVYTDPNVAAVALSARSVTFGDMSAYFVRLAGGVRFERSDEFAFNSDLVTFKAVVRGDGILADQTGAIKHFIGNAA